MQNKKVLFAALLFTAVAVFIYFYLPGYSRYQEMREKDRKMQAKIEHLEAVNKALQKEHDLFQNDMTHVEKVLRDEMGLVQPGETVYKIVEEDVAAQKAPEETSP